MRQKYQPENLPDQCDFTFTMFYYIEGYRQGEIHLYDFEFEGDEEKVVLAHIPMTVDIPPQRHLKQKVVETLNAEKLKLIAEHHVKLKGIQEKIDSLLAIEYQPGEDANA